MPTMKYCVENTVSILYGLQENRLILPDSKQEEEDCLGGAVGMEFCLAALNYPDLYILHQYILIIVILKEYCDWKIKENAGW